MTVNTPNMNLPQSTVNVDSGLIWESNLNSALSIIDAHNHSPGSGVQITPNGLNINSSLSMSNNALTNIGSLVLTNQVSLATLNSVYAIAGDLYYNDGASNIIQITSGGSVNATSSGISSGSATASFVASVLVVNAASNTPANIQGGSILLGNNVAASKFLTLSPPSAMAANFSLTLPSQPAQTNLVTLDSSGNFAAVTNVDNSTIDFSGNNIEIKALGVGTAQLANAAVTPAKMAALGQQISSSSANFVSASGSFVDVTNLSVSITVTGRPVRIELSADTSGLLSSITANASSGGSAVAAFQLLRGATVVGAYVHAITIASGAITSTVPSSSISFFDPGATAGTYTYKLQAQLLAGTSLTVARAVLTAYEIF